MRQLLFEQRTVERVVIDDQDRRSGLQFYLLWRNEVSTRTEVG
jgi:hypothetical protein